MTKNKNLRIFNQYVKKLCDTPDVDAAWAQFNAIYKYNMARPFVRDIRNIAVLDRIIQDGKAEYEMRRRLVDAFETWLSSPEFEMVAGLYNTIRAARMALSGVIKSDYSLAGPIYD